MAPNLPPSITVNRNLASTLRAFIRQNGGKNVSEVQMNQILQRVAKFDAERDAGTREGGSIFDGGSKYLGGIGKDFRVKQGQQIQFSAEEYNAIFEGFIEPITQEKTDVKKTLSVEQLKAPELNIPKFDLNEALSEKISLTAAANPEDNPVSPPLEQLQETETPEVPVQKSSVSSKENLENDIKAVFPNGLPENVTAVYINIDGAQVLIFKQNGKTLDQTQLKKLITEQNVTDLEEPTRNDEVVIADQETHPEAVVTETPAEPEIAENVIVNENEFNQQVSNVEVNPAGNPETEQEAPVEIINSEIEGTPVEETPVFNAEEQNLETRLDEPQPAGSEEVKDETSVPRRNYGLGKMASPFQDQTLDMLYNNQNVRTRFLRNANNLLGTVEYKNQNELTLSEKAKTQSSIIGKYGTPSHQWCSHAVSTIAEQSGIDIGGHKAQVQQFINWGRSKGLYNSISGTQPITSANFEAVREARANDISKQLSDMKEGDLIIWKSRYAAKTNEGLHFWDASHIGIIESADLEKGTVTVLEGNANIPRSDNTYERYIVRNSAQGLNGDQVIGEPEELNRTDGLIRKVYTIQELANFGYSGYINMQELV